MISKNVLLAVIAVSFISLSSCASNPPEPDMEALKAAVAEFYEGVGTGDNARVLALFDDSAFILPNGGRVVHGKDAVAQIWRPGIDSGFRLKDVEVLELHASGDIAYEIHQYYWGMVKEGEETEWYKTKNVHIWRWQPECSWKLHVDIWNGTPEDTPTP